MYMPPGEEQLDHFSVKRLIALLSQVNIEALAKSLDSLRNEMIGVRQDLNQVVRLEERIESHSKAIEYINQTLSEHAKDIRENEKWRLERSHQFDSATKDIRTLKDKVDTLEGDKDNRNGSDSIVASIYKWIAAILSAVVIFFITGGGKGD